MWSLAHICRCSQPVRVAQNKLLSNVGTRLISRELTTPTRFNVVSLRNTKGFRITEVIKSNGIIGRFCASGPQQKPSKAVGYWLLGCSGMVFTAVVLGMVVGYILLLYSVCYVINIIVNTTNGKK